MPQKYNFPPGYDPQKDKIEIVEFDPNWPLLYAQEEKLLREALNFVLGLSIEHIGSTSVPGLAAKPIIDIMISVESHNLWPGLVEPVKALGYVHWGTNDDGMLFVKGAPPLGEKRTHHVHVYDFEGSRWKKEKDFRDYLRTHPEEAGRYEELKRRLAAQFTFDREAYTDSKTDYILSVMEKIALG
jgi:GrpB-like predicted nucleotidyltransferase (UPF0157 family)